MVPARYLLFKIILGCFSTSLIVSARRSINSSEALFSRRKDHIHQHNFRRNVECHEDQFVCQDGLCLPPSWECDWYADCDDASDEGERCSHEGFFSCAGNGYTLPFEWLCDGAPDCPDRSDETVEICKVYGKACEQFSCDDHTVCLTATQLCDGNSDCVDGTDENIEGCEFQTSCFFCDEMKRCISWSWVCDGMVDCYDLTDEDNKLCGPVEDRCLRGNFLCAHKLFCVNSDWRCDEINDCGDLSDEDLCDVTLYWAGEAAWSEWSAWSDCSSSCNNGTTDRTRICYPGAQCIDHNQEVEECYTNCTDVLEGGCGIRHHPGNDVSLRVVGGIEAATGSWPWQAQLFFKFSRRLKMAVCGGTLVHPRLILTAAHCFITNRQQDIRRWTVHLGKHSTRKKVQSGEFSSSVMDIIIHEAFSTFDLNNDIAFVVLDTPFEDPLDHIDFGCLDDSIIELNRSSLLCFITGWGVTEMAGKQSNTLQEAYVPIINQSVCSNYEVYGSELTEGMICAGYLEGGIDACQGDSGGPLSCQDNDGRWYIVGVTSWGRGCAMANKPGVYTKVSHYTDWINNVISQFS